MSCLCIGGVCIPYSALFPILLIGLQWIAAQFAKVGLLPEFVAKRLGLNSAGKKEQPKVDSCNTGCCSDKTASRSDSAAPRRRVPSGFSRAVSTVDTDTDTTTSHDDVGDGEVEHVDNFERWQAVFKSCKNSTLFVKFTADWCKPCKVIQPAYISAASTYGKGGNKFVTLDVDGDNCDVVSSLMKVAMMPTFICFKGGVEAGRMSGGNNEEKLTSWVAEMCS